MIPPWSPEVTDVSTPFLTLLTASSVSDAVASTFSMASRLTSLTVTQGLALVQHPRELKHKDEYQVKNCKMDTAQMQMDTEAKTLKSCSLVKLSRTISFIFMLVADVARERLHKIVYCLWK